MNIVEFMGVGWNHQTVILNDENGNHIQLVNLCFGRRPVKGNFGDAGETAAQAVVLGPSHPPVKN